VFRGEKEVRWGDWRGGRGGAVSWCAGADEVSMSELGDRCYMVWTSYMIV